ncbi:Uncharacterised protein [uncultured archaeon]|nr:Uncharacterised protein [uncultured archaeon]
MIEKQNHRYYGKTLLIALTIIGLLSITANAATVGSTSTASSTNTAATNMVVDFTTTSVDSNLRPGDGGILNLVIKNTGGQSADNVQVLLSSTATVTTDKTYYIGGMDPGDSKAMPVIFTINPTAKTGLTAIQVLITYNGYKSDGSKDNNAFTTWEIPLNILGNPLFQINPTKTTYYRDTLDNLVLEGTTKDAVKDLTVTLSSSCATIMGSSSKYVGDVASNQKFTLTYPIKPSTSGACTTSIRLSYTDASGSKASDNASIGLNIEDAGVDFKVVSISTTPTGPGEETEMKISLKNVGSANADDVTLNLDLTDPFSPVTTTESYFQNVPSQGTVDANFKVAVGWSASTTSYTIPLIITYKVGGTTYNVTKDIGLDVAGRIVLEVMAVRSSSGSISIDVANIGTREADGIKATLIVSGVSNDTSGFQGGRFQRNQTGSPDQGAQVQNGSDNQNAGFRRNITGSQLQTDQRIISYKSDIKPSKQTTFTFSTTATGPATLELEYTGLNNQRVTQTERITLGSSGGSTFSGLRGNLNGGGTSMTTYAAIAIVLALAYLGYRKLKAKKKH